MWSHALAWSVIVGAVVVTAGLGTRGLRAKDRTAVVRDAVLCGLVGPLLVFLGLGLSVVGTFESFRAVADVAPVEKASVLAAGIDRSVRLSVISALAAVVPVGACAVLLVRSVRLARPG